MSLIIFILIMALTNQSLLINGKILLQNPNNGNDIEDEPQESGGQNRINLSVPGMIGYQFNLRFTLMEIILGTKWCGPGNTAENYDDLGSHKEEDMCCRDHDHCDNIPAGESKYNLTNRDYFTVLNCDCDRNFQKCLRDINSKMSNRIGRMYFTLRNHCYYDDKPIVKCDEYDTEVFLHRCVHYLLDDSKPKLYQWFDLPLYYSKMERNAIDDDIYEF